MKYIGYILKPVLLATILLFGSCKDQLTELNINPNGVDPSQANPNLILPSVQSSMGTSAGGFSDYSGVVQHTQHDAWNGGHNNFEWGADDWDTAYGRIRDLKLMMSRAEELGYTFHYGAGLVLRAFNFWLITSTWGDCPYTDAVKGDEGNEFLKPKYDRQEDVFMGVIADLWAAIDTLENDQGIGVDPAYDIFYQGDSEKWIKFAGSVLLRVYLQLSEKLPGFAWDGIEQVYNSGNYFQGNEDDAQMDFIGASDGDSWPPAYQFDNGESFRRIRMCTTLYNVLDANNDPRKEVWIDKVHCRWVADPTLPYERDTTIRRNGVLTTDVYITDAQYVASIDLGNVYTRHYNPGLWEPDILPDTGEYVAVPPQLLLPGSYNFNPNPPQTLQNQHASQLARAYREAAGGILKGKIMTYPEVCFIFAEAKFKGANIGGTAEEWYMAGIQASLDFYGVGDQFDAFYPNVAFNNTLEQIIEQKWVSFWTQGYHAWNDFRRTGLPVFSVNAPPADRIVLPLRRPYGTNEVNRNNENYNDALEFLEETSYSGPVGIDSPWSKMWLYQGTGKPW